MMVDFGRREERTADVCVPFEQASLLASLDRASPAGRYTRILGVLDRFCRGGMILEGSISCVFRGCHELTPVVHCRCRQSVLQQIELWVSAQQSTIVIDKILA